MMKSRFCETDLHPFTLKKIYQTLSMPRGLYGCEFWHDLSNSQTLHLERSHIICVKTMQGIDRCARSCVAFDFIGMPDVESENSKMKVRNVWATLSIYTVKRLFLSIRDSFFNDILYYET